MSHLMSIHILWPSTHPPSRHLFSHLLKSLSLCQSLFPLFLSLLLPLHVPTPHISQPHNHIPSMLLPLNISTKTRHNLALISPPFPPPSPHPQNIPTSFLSLPSSSPLPNPARSPPPQSLHRASISSVHSTTSPTNFLLLPVFLSTLLYYPTSPIPNPTSPIPLAMSSSPTSYFSPIAATPSSPPHALVVTSDLSSSEPSFFHQPSKSPLWCKAMDDEYHALISQKDWSLIPSSPTMNIIGCMWVYRIKRRPDGSI